MNIEKSIKENKQKSLDIISIDKIDVSKTNPRKHFDEKELIELSQSIKKYGVFQPILLRPLKIKEAGGKEFELVCGERRYRASILAKLVSIPANIRDLTDDEAFEHQIIENLERKDIHPLDEADAFKTMLDSGKYTIAEISYKMAKSESFIAQRLKLVDLIDVVREDFIAGHFGIGHAILIARCDEEKQTEIYNNAQPWDKEYTPDYKTISDLKDTIEEDTFDLSMASFDKDDKMLITECGSCTLCSKHSGFNPVLFEDMQDIDRCFDHKCFNNKELAHFHKEITRIINEAENVVLVSGYDKPDDFVLQMCKQFDIQIYGYSDWFSSERENAIEVNAFVVSGGDKGIKKQIWIKEEQSFETNPFSTDSKTPMTKEEIEAKQDIVKIETRQKRALELDEEKIWTKIRDIDTTEIQKSIVNPIVQEERLALAVALISKISWSKQKEVKEFLDINIDNIYDIIVTEEIFSRLLRIFYLDVLNESYGSCKTNVKAAAFKISTNVYYSTEIDTIENNQREIAEKRIANATSKIDVLKSKIAIAV